MNSVEPTIDEGDSLPLSVSFADTNWVSGTPSTVSYRLDCLTTGQVITGWTAITPATSVTLTLSSTQNAIINDNNRREKKRALIKAIDADGNQRSESFKYWVTNEQGVT